MTYTNHTPDTASSLDTTAEVYYSEAQPGTDPQPLGVYYTPGRHSPSRRQRKHELLLTFINHTNTPPRKNTSRKAPVKPTLLHTLLSLFV